MGDRLVLSSGKEAWRMKTGSVKIQHGDQTVVISEEEYDKLGDLF